MASDTPYHLDLEQGGNQGPLVKVNHRQHQDDESAKTTRKEQRRRPASTAPLRGRGERLKQQYHVSMDDRVPPTTAMVHESRKVGFGGGCCLGGSLACLLVLLCCILLPVVLVLVVYHYLQQQMENSSSAQAWQDYISGGGSGGAGYDWKDYQMDDATISNYFAQFANQDEGDDDDTYSFAKYSEYFSQWWEGNNSNDGGDRL
jgi:hypothetical protein